MKQEYWKKGLNAALMYFNDRASNSLPKRKPVWAIRLHDENGSIAIIKPCWDGSAKQVSDTHALFELWEPLTVNGSPVPTRQLAGVISDNDMRMTTYKISKSNIDFSQLTKAEKDHILAESKALAMQQAEKIKDMLADFAKDPSKVMSRVSDSCCICGKGLTDEVSRSRGIGPECMKYFNFLAKLVARDSLIAKVPYKFEDHIGEKYQFHGQHLADMQDESMYRSDDGQFYIFHNKFKLMQHFQEVTDLEMLLLWNDPADADEDLDGRTTEDQLQDLSQYVLLFTLAAEKCPDIQPILNGQENLVNQAVDYLNDRMKEHFAQGRSA